MDYGRAAEILGRRKWLILFSVLVTMVLTWGATRLTGARWQTTVRLIAPSTSPLTDAPNSRSDTGTMDARSQATMYATVAKSHDVIQNAIKQTRIEIAPLALAGSVDFEAAGARMFELRVSDSSPSRSERLANAVADSFVDEVHDLTTQQAQKVVSLLEEQQRQEDAKLTAIRARYDDYSARHGVLGNPASQLALIFKRLELARQGRDEAQARLADAEARLIGRRSQIAQTPATISGESDSSSRPMVVQLEEQLARKETELIDLRSHYTDADPKVQAALEARKSLQKRLREETNRHEASRQQNPEVAPLRQTAAELQQEVSSEKAVIAAQNKNIAQAENEIMQLRGLDSPLSTLTSEITAGTEARQSLATRLNSARAALDVAEQGNPLVVLEKGGPSNPPQNMSSGRTKKLVLLAALCALIVTSGLVIALDSMDRRLKSVEEAELVLPARVIAAIPPPVGDVAPESLPRITERQPASPHAEAYRFLAQRVLGLTDKRIRTFITLSARPGQGSTSAISNLGILLAQAGHRVILVDANTRNPRLHTIFEIGNGYGLSNVLENPDIFAVKQALYSTTVPNLQVLPSGHAPENPWGLFSSQRLNNVTKFLLERADYVLFDTPSATAFADTMNLASVADAAVLCVRALEALTGEEARLVEKFEQAGVMVLGSVLSHVPMTALESYRNAQRPVSNPFTQVPVVVENFPKERENSTENKITAHAAADETPVEETHSLLEERIEPEAIAADVPIEAPAAIETTEPVTAAAAPSEPVAVAAMPPETTEPAASEPETAESVTLQDSEPETAAVSTEAEPFVSAEEAQPVMQAEVQPDVPEQTEAVLSDEHIVTLLDEPEAEPEVRQTGEPPFVVPEEWPAVLAEQHEAALPEAHLPDYSVHAEAQADAPQTAQIAAPPEAPEATALPTVLPTAYETMPQVGAEPIAMEREPFDALSETITKKQEFDMTMPTAEFPRATGGYAPGAVDEYARHMAARFEMMQRQTEQQASRAARYAADAERLTEELEEARRTLSGLLEKEAAQASSALQSEQKRVQTDQELEAARKEARAEAERLVAQARADAAALLEEARRSAEESNARVAAYVSQSEQMLQAAKREADAQKRQAREAEIQLEELTGEMEMERAQAKTEAAHLEAAARQQKEEAEAHLAAVHAEAERIREQAQSEAAKMLEEARGHAEEISMYAAAAHAAHEERLQSLSTECDEIVIRTRRALESQLALLPMPASSDRGSSLLRNIFPSTSESERDTKTEEAHGLHTSEWPSAVNGSTARAV